MAHWRAGRTPASLTYLDKSTRTAVVATRVTAVVVSGGTARVYGQARVNGSGSWDFVADLEDRHDYGGGADRLRLEVSSGLLMGPSALSGGSIEVRGG